MRNEVVGARDSLMMLKKGAEDVSPSEYSCFLRCTNEAGISRKKMCKLFRAI